ncbi:hypothetical protein QC334_34615 [Streptomyces sp. DH18]|uniref:hypothetical protein n=1 Tax=Streptomyces sp. DH18 TaxID=3040126 RepID=UPI0024430ED1|nr:hypothetical protein [Streptomyces sp. DH18]MDG9687804.1 hypothetical protein [Streptomyces sp. DH18]
MHTVQHLAHDLRPGPQDFGDLDLRAALGKEAERGQLAFGKQVLLVRIGRTHVPVLGLRFDAGGLEPGGKFFRHNDGTFPGLGIHRCT